MNKPERVQTGEQIHFPQLRLLNLADGKISVKGTAVKTPTQPQLWVPHISLVFGEMWEMNLLSRLDPLGFVHLDRSAAQWSGFLFRFHAKRFGFSTSQILPSQAVAQRLHPIVRRKDMPLLP